MDMNTMNINRKMSETLKKLAEIQARTAPFRLRIGTVKNGTVHHDCIEIEDAPPTALELLHNENNEIGFIEIVRRGKYTLLF